MDAYDFKNRNTIACRFARTNKRGTPFRWSARRAEASRPQLVKQACCHECTGSPLRLRGSSAMQLIEGSRNGSARETVLRREMTRGRHTGAPLQASVQNRCTKLPVQRPPQLFAFPRRNEREVLEAFGFAHVDYSRFQLRLFK